MSENDKFLYFNNVFLEGNIGINGEPYEENPIGLSEEFRFKNPETIFYGIGPVSKVNFFVGANNSRKSRFMRLITSLREAIFTDIDLVDNIENWKADAKKMIELTTNTKLLIDNYSNPTIIEDIFKGYAQPFDNKFFVNVSKQVTKLIYCRAHIVEIENALTRILNEANSVNKYDTGDPKVSVAALLDELKDPINSTITLIEHIKGIQDRKASRKHCIYIPSLRGALKTNSNDIYSDIINKYYPEFKDSISSSTGNDSAKVFTGNSLYDDILRDRNSTRDARIKFEEFQKFIGKHFFGTEKLEIVAEPNSNEDKHKIRFWIDGSNEHEFQHIGDGIQSLIILLYPIFLAEDNSWIFIDEPELSLHPGFQNVLLDTILQNEFLTKKNLRYFLTTHSNHFLGHSLRYPGDVSIFNFSPIDGDKSLIRCVHGSNTDSLDCLGVENASVYMANCSIWVEGISDRKYVQAFLKAYCEGEDKKEFIEGLDYAFFEYAGSNLTHYLFEELEPEEKTEKNKIEAKFLSSKIFLLADKDRDKEEKHRGLENIQKQNFKYTHTQAIEIENTLPPSTVNAFLESKGHSKIANLKHSQYNNKGLGKFLSDNIAGVKFKGKSSTLSAYYKDELHNFVYDQVISGKITWNELKESPYIVTITEAIYKFISDHNKTNNNPINGEAQ